MSEFNAYLEKLGAALDVSPRRADEILAEARTHLEAKAAGLEAGGLSRAEAVREAIGSFGEAREMAERLTRANGKHQRAGIFWPTLAFALAFAGIVLAFGLIEGGSPLLQPLLQPLRALKPPIPTEEGQIVPPALAWNLVVQALMLLLMGPIAMLAGAVAGRRWWPLVGVPLALWGFVILLIETYPENLVLGSAMVCVAAPLAALWGLLGLRLSERKDLSRRLAVSCLAYLALMGLHTLFLQAHDAVGFLAATMVALLVGVMVWLGFRRARLEATRV
jgi:hypothetical protein